MGSFTDYFEKKVMNALFGNDTIASITLSIALFGTAPSDASGGTEITGGNYARLNFSNSWSSATALSANTTTATFVTATGAWGSISCFAAFDATTNGNMIFWATLSVAQTVVTANVVQFATGSLTLSLD